MKFEVRLFNELPFMVELKDGNYQVKTDMFDFNFCVSSDYYKLIVAPFPEKADNIVYYGDKKSLTDIVINKNYNSYAFSKSKTFVETSIIEESDFTESDINNVPNEKVLDEVKGQLIRNSDKIISPEELNIIANDQYSKLDEVQLKSLKL